MKVLENKSREYYWGDSINRARDVLTNKRLERPEN